MAEKMTTQQNTNTKVNTTQFHGMGFVGIKKVEYFSKGGESVVFDDVMELLENRNYTSNLMLGFFSINPFGIEKVDKIDSILSMNEDSNENLIKQHLKKAALFDFAEAKKETVGSLNILIVADAIIHWDNTGSYIQPTQENAMMLDLEDIVRMYPASYKIKIYTQRDLTNFTFREFEKKDVLDVPVKTDMWYNQPNFQELYGSSVLITGLITLALTYGAMNWQESKLKDLSSNVSALQSQSINQSYYSESNNELAELNESLKYKGILSIIEKDISNSLSKSGFKLDSLDFVRTENKETMIVSIASKKDSHNQFSVQEPLAQRILDNSQTIKAIRKKITNDSRFVLEALVDLKAVKLATQKLGGRD